MPGTQNRRLRLRRESLTLVVATAAFATAYFVFLAYQNHRAEVYYEHLRQTDPLRYLDDQRLKEGFASYLDKFRLLEGYTSPKPAVPPFLVGRWTMRPKPMRVAPGTVFGTCSDPITFEQGLVQMMRGEKPVDYKVDYGISGQDVVLTGPDLARLKVTLISYGAAIDHLELVPPGRSGTVYAYRCSN